MTTQERAAKDKLDRAVAQRMAKACEMARRGSVSVYELLAVSPQSKAYDRALRAYTRAVREAAGKKAYELGYRTGHAQGQSEAEDEARHGSVLTFGGER